MNEQLGFIFQGDKCIQCHGCEMACKMWRGLNRDIVWRRVINIWSGVYPDVTCASLSLGCLHCNNPACMEACPTGAISKRGQDGVVLVDNALCTGCRACLEACPYDVPQFGADELMQKCDMCVESIGTGIYASAPPCVRTCPTGALEIAVVSAEQKAGAENEIAAQYRNTV